jgi:CSLREA domain-containing protein
MSAELFLGSSRSSGVSRFVGNGRWLAPLLLLAMAGAAHAMDTFTVNSLTDDPLGIAANCPANAAPSGTCTLRDAIAATNSDSNASTIQFSVSGTLVLSSTLIIDNSSAALTITNQSGTGPIAISGNNAMTVFGLYPGTATFAYLTITNGSGGSGDAGGIYNLANLTLSNTVLINNTTASGIGGGGVYNANGATLTVSYSSFYNNSETLSVGGVGGAIENSSGASLTVSDSTFSGNRAYSGAAIENDSANALVVTNTTFSGNVAGHDASGIYNAGPALTVSNSTFWGNNLDGIAYAGSALNIYNSLFDFGSECASAGPACPSTGDGHGNVVAPTNSVAGSPAMLPLGNYGGPTQTLLPMPGSSAICAGIYANVPVGVTTDQRTFPLNSSCVDAGAVQSNYITVTTGADDATGVPANCPGAGCELRDAVSKANAAGDGDIDFTSGLTTVTLTSAGPTTNVNANIVGPGANSLTVTEQNENALFSTSGGNAFLYGMTFANGNKTGNGDGGAIYNQANLTVSGMAFTGNFATIAGGAIYNESGAVTVLNSSFVNNTASEGSAIFNNSTNGAITVEYSTFANNTAATPGTGAIYSVAGAPLSIYSSTLAGNTGGGIDFGGSSAMTVENSLLGESTECTVSGGGACPTTGTLGNVVTPTNSNNGMPALSAIGSYSGTNTAYSTQTMLPEPGSSAICAGSSTLIPAGVTTDQRGFSNENLTYTGYSSNSPCVDAGAVQTNYTSAQFVGTPPYAGTADAPGTTPPVILSVTENGQNVGGVQATLTFSGTGSASGLTATTLEGTGATYSSIEATQPSGASPDTLSITLPVVGSDTLTAGPVNMTVATATQTAPSITSASSTTFTTGTAGSFTVTATGYPTPTFSETGPLPSGVTLTSAGVLSGTPAAATGGAYPITITAQNGNSPNATQSFTLTVNQVPAITSATSTTFAVGTARTFSVTATGYPAPTFSTTSTLPSGVTLTSAGVLSGTPAAATGGTYPITITAQNGVSPNATQPFTLTVNQAPAITSATSTTFAVGTAGTFSVTATGTPAPTFSETGNLPSGVTLTSAGVLSGTPAAGTGGAYPIIITAQNGVSPNATQNFTLTVNQAPAITSATSTSFALGSANSFSVTATGYPASTFSETGSLPSGVTLTTAGVLSGTPAAGTSGTYPITITAQNGTSPNATQNFTLTEGSPTPIVPYIQDYEQDGGAWQNVSSLTVNYGDTVNLGPQPGTGGSWSWTGPSGFTSTSRALNGISLPSGTNVYTATYTNSIGLTSTQAFTITIAPTTITPYLEVNGGAWQATNNIAVAPGSTVNLGPQAAGSGTWSWSGPGFTSSAQQINNVPLTSASNVYTATFTNAAGVISTEAFTITIAPTTITPYLEVNGGAWQATNNIAVAPGSSVNLGPQAAGSGTWSWSGPGFTSSAQQVNNVPLNSASNVYTATFTNAGGATSTETFTITIAPTTITPYIEVNGAWQATNSVTVAAGSTVNLGPQAAGTGTWSWSGPSFTASTQQVNNIPLNSASNVYTATFTNAAGVQSTEIFTITVAPTTITPYLEVNGGAWQGTNSVTVAAGSTVNLGPQAAGSGTWSWSGPGFTSSAQQVNNVPLTSASNVYTATFTNAAGVQSTEIFTITVAPTTITPYLEVNGGAWQGTNNVTVAVGSTVNLGPQASGSGTWSWSGPGFTASTEQVNNVPLNSASNVYTATFTNANGVQSTEAFTITIAPTTITPYLLDYKQDGGAWQATANLTANYGDTVDLGPQAAGGGTWSWSGPGGFTSSTQQINNVPLNAASNVFTATYTNPVGVTSMQSFTITIAPTAIAPYVEVDGGVWQNVTSVTVNPGDTVNLGPQPGNGGSWSWAGPNGFSSNAREIDNIPLAVGTNTYVATYTNQVGATSTETFVVTLN